MGRELKRVPLDFDWPLKEVWKGYIEPWQEFHFPECRQCEGSGATPYAKFLMDRWYGNAPFDPAETGSTPLTPETPEVRAFAERNVGQSPDFYGSGERAIVREAERLCALWNKQWNHHLSQDDVDALIAGNRLWDFTREIDPGGGWKDKNPIPVITAAEVNAWSINGWGHDSINQWVVVSAACERAGVEETCPHCKGHGDIATDEQREAADHVETYEPPAGDGYQLWETTSEGSPVTPVFATIEELCDYAAINCSTFADIKATAEEWRSMQESAGLWETGAARVT